MGQAKDSDRHRARVVCTGGFGYLGSVLTDRLLDRGHDVVVVDTADDGTRFSPSHDVDGGAKPRGQLSHVRCDLRDVEPSLFEAGDVVVHLGGVSNDDAFDADPVLGRTVNVEATLILAEAAGRAGAQHFILASSCSVYGRAEAGLVAEDSPVHPVSGYARSKAECETRLPDAAGGAVGVTSLRFGTLFGWSPRMRFDLVVNRMTKTAVDEGRVRVTGGGAQWRPLLHVADAAGAVIAAADAGAPPTPARFNVVGENLSMRDLGRQVARCLGVPVEIDGDEIADPRSYAADGCLIRTMLGFQPIRLVVDGVREVQAELVSDTVIASPADPSPGLIGRPLSRPAEESA